VYKRQSIFLFLDEKTTLFEEIKIFLSLPIKPFLKALSLDFRKKGFYRYLFGLLIVLIYNLLYSTNVDIANYFNYLSLLVGLLWVGIPHGALDHLLTKNKKTSLFNFIASYLLIVGLYLLLWQFLPLFSLLVFVVYSSFHFGESEIIQNKESVKTFKEYLKAFAFGFTILTFIISTHLDESINIIQKMTNVSDLFFLEINRQFIQVILSLFSFSFILAQYLQTKKSSIISLLLLLIAGMFVPLMLAFGLYFILQHSYNAWTHLQKGLQLNSLELHKKSALFTFGAVLIFVTITFLIRDSSNLQALWTNFFVFIACISLPHFVLMHLFYKSMK
jgi:Brp/Blh family beta-carotene 15,15'-monooxygenase